MGSFGQVKLKKVLDMLKECAPEHETEETDHYYCVKFGGKEFPSLPKGKHGSKSQAEIDRGVIKQMVNHLEIDPKCANKEIPSLNLRVKPNPKPKK